MSDQTPRLDFSLMSASQAQKEVTFNDAMRALDVLVQGRVLDMDLATPPASPDDGDAYIVAASPTGLWTGRATQIATWFNGVWNFVAPDDGFALWVVSKTKRYTFTGSAWTSAAEFDSISPMTTLGDIIYGGASGAGTRLPGNTSATKKFLSQTGSGSASAAPAWAQVTAADIVTTTVASALIALANPSAISFLRINADNSVSARSASNFRTDLGLGTGDSPTLAGLTTTGDVIIGGNLTVNGTTTHVNSTTVDYDDGMLKLADGNASDTLDEGWYCQYQPSATPLYAGLFRDASDGKFKLYKDLQSEPTTTVNIGGTGYTAATLTVGGIEVTGLTSGRVPYATSGGALTDSSALQFTGARLLVGGPTDDGASVLQLQVSAATAITFGSPNPIVVTTVSDSSSVAIGQRRARAGTLAVQTDDILGTNQFSGYDGGAYGVGGFLRFFAAENWASGTNRGTYADIFTTPTGSTTNTRAMRFGANGAIGIGGLSDPDAFLTISANATLSGPQIRLRSRRAAMTSGSMIGGMDFMSNDTDLTAPGTVVGLFQCLANQTHTASQLGTKFQWSLTANGATSTSDLMVLTGGGALIVNTPTDDGINKLQVNGGAAIAGTLTLSAQNIATDTSTGMKIGTSTSQKLGFFNATPVTQQSGSTDVLASLVNLGLRAASSNPGFNIGTGAIACGAITAAGVCAVTPYRANISGAVSIDLTGTAKSNELILTLTGNVTSFALTNPTDGATYNIRFIQDGTGGRTVSGLSSKFKFAGGTPPVFSSAAGAVDFMSADYGATEDTYMAGFSKGMA
ncbi:MAG TPA: DUF2793 domain-containing protein [Nevskiaceae bacterium]|nr:DUF2793 domain-containing protein [Nevskiaceae bacterium]